MRREQPVTETQARFEQAALSRSIFFFLFYLVLGLGILVLSFILYFVYLFNQTYGITYFEDPEKHFKYGSIGAELSNGLPLRLFRALPELFPEEFGGKGNNYSHFGFVYERDTDGDDRALPIGFAEGYRNSVKVAWFNCSVCHVGKVKLPGATSETTVLGMPANTVDLERFFLALFRMVEDKKFTWENEALRKAVNRSGPRDLTLFERTVIWPWLVMPNTRNVLLDRRSRLLPLLDPSQTDPVVLNKVKQGEADICKPKPQQTRYRHQDPCSQFENEINLKKPKQYGAFIPPKVPAWGPGRVDTFNPYKLINFNLEAHCLDQEERFGVSDFPPIYQQRPRGEKMMHLHWDGNNASIDERNLNAAFGAGVTEETINHDSLKVIAEWMWTLKPDSSPYRRSLDSAQLERGRAVYMTMCAFCHGYEGKSGYVYEGSRLGKIEPIDYVRTDPARMASYTSELEEYQKERLFCKRRDRAYRYKSFKNTSGYANQPLDALWLRAPYLHNGSVPTLYDLLQPASERPETFRRGITELDAVKGGFVSPACDPSDNTHYKVTGKNFCFDTRLKGNLNSGHEYGIYLSDDAKRDLITYLLSF